MNVVHTVRFLAGLAACLFIVAGSALQAADQPTRSREATTSITDIAREAYIYGLPLVSDYALMHAFTIDPDSAQFRAPFNEVFSNRKKLTPADTGIAFPNNDTLYSTAWLDLRAEPIVVRLPRVRDQRYHSLMLIDGSTVNYGTVSSRSSDESAGIAGDYLIVGPNWQGVAPNGITKVFRATTDFSLVIFRIQLRAGEHDLDKVMALQDGFHIEPLSAWAGTETPQAAPEINFPNITRELAQKDFFAYLNFILNLTPIRPEDANLRKKLASIGIGTGNPEDFSKIFLPIAMTQREAIVKGVELGKHKIRERVAEAYAPIDGWDWSLAALDSDRSTYTGDYLRRAALFQIGPYGLNAYEAVYPMTRTMANGEALDTGSFNYSITFPAGQLPPVDAFWSLTVYGGETKQFVENTLGRYLINSEMLSELTRNDDGSLTLYVQADSPGEERASNWLPAPEGPVYLVLRLYGPEAVVFEGEWKIPPVVKTGNRQ